MRAETSVDCSVDYLVDRSAASRAEHLVACLAASMVARTVGHLVVRSAVLKGCRLVVTWVALTADVMAVQRVVKWVHYLAV